MNKKHQIIIAAFVLLSLTASGLFIVEQMKFSRFKDQSEQANNKSQQTIDQLTVAKQSAESTATKLKSDLDILQQKSQTLGIELTNRQALCEQQAKDFDKLSKDYALALDAAKQSEQLASHYEKVSRDILDAWKKQVEE